MVILFILFVVQFSIACACLAVSDEQQHDLAAKGWRESGSGHRIEAQQFFGCCGFSNQSLAELDLCSKVNNQAKSL